ncbi:DinB family protein [uncultured Roseobacter sp.]|uniref:DinB family protein n=1 Tax=uncultured Roseobacter sp. TaxID=114847 RepID=UPI00263A12C2|nr:DinB family protein [uncultured Roseobacter sp.]
MPDLSLVHRMTAYMAWADDVMLKNAEQLDESALMAPHDTLFGSISGTFDHTLVVAEMFRAHLDGGTHPHVARRRSDALPFREVARRLREMNAHYVDLARRWTEAELSQIIHFEFVGGGTGAMSREDILLHLVNHATYHRGFVSTLLFPQRIAFAPNDLTVFLRDVWPDLAETAQGQPLRPAENPRGAA